MPRQRPIRKVHHSFASEAHNFLLKGLTDLVNILENVQDFNAPSINAAVKAFLLLPVVITGAKKRVLEKIGEIQSSGIILNYEKIFSYLVQRPTPAQWTDSSDPKVSDDRKKLFVKGLVKKQQLSKAAQKIMDSAQIAELVDSDSRAWRKAVQLHPEVDDFIVEDPRPNDFMNDFSFETVEEALKHLPKESSTAFSPWTYELLRWCATKKEDNDPDSVRNEPEETSDAHGLFLSQLTRLCNLMAKGKVGSPHLWLNSRLIMLNKPDGGLRPISIQDVFYRLTARLVSNRFSSKLRFGRHQKGVANRNGAEIAVRIANVANHILTTTDEDIGIIKIDFQNAFNCISRKRISDELQKQDVGLHKLFHWAYNQSTLICNDASEAVCLSRTGVKQGDPLGPMYFSLGLKNILDPFEEEMGCHMVSYLDDVLLIGKLEDVWSDFERLVSLTRARGLLVNKQKCLLYCRPGRLRDGARIDIPMSFDGMSYLGVPIGNKQYLDASLDEMLVKFKTPIINELPKYSADVAYPLLQYCFAPKLNYIFRNMSPEDASPFSKEVDKVLDSQVLILANAGYLELPYRSALVRSLPVRMGGLGISNAQATQLCAFHGSFITTIPKIHRHLESSRLLFPYLRSYTEQFMPSIQEFIAATTPNSMAIQSSSPSPIDYMDLVEAKDCKKYTQKHFTLAAMEKRHEKLEELLKDTPDFAAWHRSILSDTTASAWMYSIYNGQKLRYPHLSFSANLKARLLLPAWEHYDTHTRVCKCKSIGSRPLDPIRNAFHPISCNLTAGERNKRHHALCHAVGSFIQRCIPNAEVEYEPHMKTKPGVTTDIRADIQYSIGGQTRFIDVSVTNPCAQDHISKGSADRAFVASQIRRKSKLAYYEKNVRDVLVSRLDIFMVEATGSMDGSSHKLIDLLMRGGVVGGPEPTAKLAFERQFLVSKISRIMAEYYYFLNNAWFSLKAKVMNPNCVLVNESDEPRRKSRSDIPHSE